MTDPVRRAFEFVSDHNVAVLLVMLLLSAGVVAGASQLQLQNDSGGDATHDTEVAEKLEYVRASYGAQNDSNASDTRPAVVYVRDEGNALSKDALLASLRYQQTVLENESVAASLGDRRVIGVANIVATRAAGERNPTLDEQIAALEAATESEVKDLVRTTLTEGSRALKLLPRSYEPGTATAESHRIVFQFADDGSRSVATAALYETAGEHDDPELFTRGKHAITAANTHYQQNTLELLLPAALAVILAVLAFSYRDVVDVVVGFVGVLLSVLWMFGIMGWLRIPAGVSLIIGPVLIIGLSVDYGLHVFMRYREQRGRTDDVREPMARGLSSVTVALGLVTLTTMVGFLSNATSDLATIKQLSYAITLGVLSTFVVSLTVIPALKITVDRLLERIGLDRRKTPLGKAGWLEPVLRSGAQLARRAAPAVIVVALLVGGAGAVAWTDLDRQSVQQGSDVAEWKQDLPEPLGWDVSEESRQGDYVREQYRSVADSEWSRSNVLIEDDVTDPAALESVRAAHEAAADSAIVYQRGDATTGTSPLTVMRAVAAENEAFARQFAAADTDDDGVPDRNVAALYDALFAAAPDEASRVIDRDGGEYRSIRVIVPIQESTTISERASGMADIAGGADTGEAVTVTAVGDATVAQAELSRTADNILETLVLALVAVSLLLTAAYRLTAGSASLGAITAVPITLVSAMVIGGMWLTGTPLTLLTALLLSLVIGIGIDYNIHISDRFVQELDRGRSVRTALVNATTGTGGALLGSTLTSAGAFSALLLHPHPQFQSFGTLVVLAMLTSFVVAVFVLPSMLAMWARHLRMSTGESTTPEESALATDD